MDLGLTAHSFLTGIASRLDAAGISVPTRQFVSAGEIVDDCPQLAISVIRLFNGSPAREQLATVDCVTTRSAELEVRLTRCWPADSPSLTTITSNGRGIMNDAAALADAARAVLGTTVAGVPLPIKNDVAIGSASIIGPSGGVIAVSLLIQVHLMT